MESISLKPVPLEVVPLCCIGCNLGVVGPVEALLDQTRLAPRIARAVFDASSTTRTLGCRGRQLGGDGDLVLWLVGLDLAEDDALPAAGLELGQRLVEVATATRLAPSLGDRSAATAELASSVQALHSRRSRSHGRSGMVADDHYAHAAGSLYGVFAVFFSEFDLAQDHLLDEGVEVVLHGHVCMYVCVFVCIIRLGCAVFCFMRMPVMGSAGLN